MSSPERLTFAPNGDIPNHPRFPVLVYRQAFDDPGELRDRLAANRWPVDWTGGVYDYHHYHSTAHEFLAVVAGGGELLVGGPDAARITLATGDALVLPAGTGHRRGSTDPAFTVIGAYPEGQVWDLIRSGETPPPEVEQRIAAVALPTTDPLHGSDGPLTTDWTAAD